MANLLENMLSGGAVKRQDNKHLAIVVRPLPVRPRQLLELFGAMGTTATMQGLLRAVELKGSDPHQVVFIALGRWPTLEEVAALPDPYQPRQHLLELVRSREFRAHLVRRACEAFAERKRLLFVQVPRSGGQSVLDLLDGRHPLLPLDLNARRFDDPILLAQTLGHVFSRMSVGNSLAIAHSRMATFLDPPAQPAGAANDPLTWQQAAPPCRPEDLLFTVMREPVARALGQVNALLSAWQSGERDLPAPMRARLDGAGRRPRLAAWRELGRTIIAETVLRNPICHALGDGTAEGALRACSRSPIQLVQLEQLNLWARSALENMASDTPAASEPILRRQDLGPTETEAIAAATQEDQIIYDRFAQKVKAAELPVVRAREI